MIQTIQIIGILLACYAGPLWAAKVLANILTDGKNEGLNTILAIFAAGMAMALSGLIF